MTGILQSKDDKWVDVEFPFVEALMGKSESTDPAIAFKTLIVIRGCSENNWRLRRSKISSTLECEDKVPLNSVEKHYKS